MSQPLVAYDPEFELFEGAEASQSQDGRGLGEVVEMALATELLDVPHEPVLDQYARRFVARTARGLRTKRPTRFSATPIGLMSDALRRVRASDCDAAPGSATLGGRIAALAEPQLRPKPEGLSPEDREFESARQITRVAIRGIVGAPLSTPPAGPGGPHIKLIDLRDHYQEEDMHNIDRNVVASHSEAESFESGT
jgi:hypothetical protein